MRRFPLLLLLALFVTITSSAQTLDEALTRFRELKFDESATLFEALARSNPSDPTVKGWLALNYRYLERYTDAIDVAYEVLALSPCDALAHTVIADSYNRQNWPDSKAALDTIWEHLTTAVQCDSNAMEAWTSIWIHAMRRKDAAMERAALRRLYHSGFVTKGTLNGMRLFMRDLPKNAIFIANGDLDTYPALALQQEEGFRTDVAVVNWPMLGLDWYARHVRDRYRIPLSLNDRELASYYDEAAYARRVRNHDYRSLETYLIDGWFQSAAKGKLARPVTISTNVGMHALDTMKRGFSYTGGFFLFTKKGSSITNDTAALRRFFTGQRPDDFAGPLASDLDPSPVRRAADNYAATVAIAIMTYTYEMVQAGRIEEARRTLDLGRRFVNVSSNAEKWEEYLDEIEKATADTK